MQEEAGFGDLYKKLMDCYFEPDSQRSGETLSAVMRALFRRCPPEEENSEWKNPRSCDKI